MRLQIVGFRLFQKYGCESEVLLLVSHANDLKNIDEDFERNWLFVYEILEGKDLTGEWAKLKKQKFRF